MNLALTLAAVDGAAALIAVAAETAAPGSASAQGLELKGMNFIDGDTIKTIFAFLGCAVTGLFTYLKMKASMEKKLSDQESTLRAEIANELRAKVVNDPLHVAKVQDCVTVQECNRRMQEFNVRLCTVEQKLGSVFETILAKLDDMDSKSEQRSIDLHRRVDAISEKTSETAGAVELIKAKMFKRS